MQSKQLTQGPILKQLIGLALPILGTNFINMSYTLLDMFWLGRVSTGAVASVGLAGYALWAANSLAMISRIGAEIGVGQSIGRKDTSEAVAWFDSAYFLNVRMAVVYGVLILLVAPLWIGFFQMTDASVNADAIFYLRIVAVGMPATFLNPLVSGALTGAGDSHTPFVANTMGLALNMLLDPLLILGFGWGVAGAGVATVIAQYAIAAYFLLIVCRKHELFLKWKRGKQRTMEFMRSIFQWGWPASVQSLVFAGISAFLSRLVTGFGAEAYAAYGVGVQIESIGWLTLVGFTSALAAFSAQNFGVHNIQRLWRGFFHGSAAAVGFSLLVSLVLYFGAPHVIRWFFPLDNAAQAAGILYLQIIALFQIPAAFEYTAGGTFQGMGRTWIPSVAGIGGNLLRIPMAYLFRAAVGLAGIFWAIGISSAVKGLALLIWFVWIFRKEKGVHDESF